MRSQSLPSLLDHFFADFDAPLASVGTSRSLHVDLDLIEHPDRFEIVADLPGARQEDVEVEFSENVLHIRGERSSEPVPEEARQLRRERPKGRFSRSLAFRDEVEVEGIEASFREGVLRITVPKSARSRPREIAVTVH